MWRYSQLTVAVPLLYREKSGCEEEALTEVGIILMGPQSKMIVGRVIDR